MTDEKSTATEPRVSPPESAAAGQSPRVLLAQLRHDLRTPINAIIGYSELLLQDMAELDRDDFREELHQIRALGGESLTVITERLTPFGNQTEAESLCTLWEEIRRQLARPVHGVICQCQRLLERVTDPTLEPFVPDLKRIHTAALALSGLTEKLVPAARPEPSRPEPSVSESAAVNGTLPSQEELPGGVRGHVLIVDDVAPNRDLLARYLYRQGHHFTLAHNGHEALDLLRKKPIVFDLVLLDIMMPDMDGIQVLRALKADPELHYLPVIMISALDEMDSVVRCIEMGADDYLPKPFNQVLLKARIGACLEKKRLRDRELAYLREIQREQERGDALLHVILPGAVVQELKATNSVRPRRFENVAVLFADIVGFTSYCDQHEPEEVVTYLQQLVETWENIALRHRVQKIKTIGDAFMATSGLLEPAENPVLNCIQCGQELIASAQALVTRWNVRIGIHSGPVVAGVLGRRQYLFDLWGDTVNTAARMEANGVPGSITLSKEAWQQIAHCCRGESRGLVSVKGKGDLEVFRLQEIIRDAKDFAG
ncbi:MAG TPA: adenylate/guanylate cyclase domain-containing protein [Gemmataceae bacterium]|nr:adenylate/guanylate cyclase domain-containing protein [Gemmataceae bacterium]